MATARSGEVRIHAVLAGLMLAMLLAALDQNIVAVALPRIGADLRGFDLLAWVVSAYLIASAVATPLFGKLGDVFGRRQALSAAIVLFMLGAIGCALAPTMPTLVAARALQGAGGGAIIALVQAAIADVVPPRERGRYQIYFSTVHIVASVAGPVAGGLLTQHLSWHWIFWLDVPLGLLALLAARRSLAPRAAAALPVRIDYAGALLLTGGLLALLIGVTRIGMGAALTAPEQLALYGSALLLLGLFVWWEGRAPEPLVPLTLFALPTVRLSCYILFVCYMQLVAIGVLAPLRSQVALGAAVDEAALRLLPLSLAGPVGAWLAGRRMLRSGRTRGLQIGGAALVAAGLACFAYAPAPLELALLGLIGLGIGMQMPTSLVAIQSAVSAHQVGIATASAAFCRSLGAAIGMAVLGALLVWLLGDSGSSGAGAMRQLAMASAPDPALLARAHGAFHWVFLASALIATTGLVAALRLPPIHLHAQ